MSNSSIIPNSFQCPNFYVDRLDYLLTPEESKVLIKAIREILGWESKIVSRQAHIALSVFVRGKTNADGEQLCYGCGIGLQTVREALMKLDKFNVLVKVGQPASEGQLYQLQTDPLKIDWDGLQNRRREWDSKNSERTARATIASLEKRGVTSDVKGNVGRNAGITSDVTQGVTSDVNKETHEKPNEKPNHGASAEDKEKLSLNSTPNRRILKAKFVANISGPNKHRPPAHFSTLILAEKFDAHAARLDGQLSMAIDAALVAGINSIPRIVAYLANYEPNNGGNRGKRRNNDHAAKPAGPGDGVADQLEKALRSRAKPDRPGA